jgi:hypothetical protein
LWEASFSSVHDTDSKLVIQMKLVWSWVSFAKRGTPVFPALTGNARPEWAESDELGTPGVQAISCSSQEKPTKSTAEVPAQKIIELLFQLESI